jgi:D-threo-aldose 1-dehydrogenase
MLPKRKIGETGLEVTTLGLGAAPLGNLFRPMDDDAAAEILSTALGAGIRYVDTAPFYGFGLSEQRVGRNITGEDRPIVSTKVGRALRPVSGSGLGNVERHGFFSPVAAEPEFDYRGEAILRSHQESVARLGPVDILYIHDIGRRTHGDLDSRYRAQLFEGGGLEALLELRNSGAVSAVGLGVNEIDVCLDLLAAADLDVILLAGRYTLLEQHALDRLLPLCVERGVSVVIGGPFNSGILAAGASAADRAHFDYGPVPGEVRDRVAKLERACREFDVPLAAAALQFPLAHPAVASVIPGFASAAEVASGIEFFTQRIPPDLWHRLKSERLIDERAPVPQALEEEDIR